MTLERPHDGGFLTVMVPEAAKYGALRMRALRGAAYDDDLAAVGLGESSQEDEMALAAGLRAIIE